MRMRGHRAPVITARTIKVHLSILDEDVRGFCEKGRNFNIVAIPLVRMASLLTHSRQLLWIVVSFGEKKFRGKKIKGEMFIGAQLTTHFQIVCKSMFN